MSDSSAIAPNGDSAERGVEDKHRDPVEELAAEFAERNRNGDDVNCFEILHV